MPKQYFALFFHYHHHYQKKLRLALKSINTSMTELKAVLSEVDDFVTL